MLTDPQAVIGAIFQVFDRLGIDRDAVVMVSIFLNKMSNLKVLLFFNVQYFDMIYY